MEQKQMFKQMIDFNRAAFENGFNAMVMMQDQAERMTSMFVDQSSVIPKESKKLVDEWLKACKKGRDELKKSVDQSFNQFQDYFDLPKG